MLSQSEVFDGTGVYCRMRYESYRFIARTFSRIEMTAEPLFNNLPPLGNFADYRDFFWPPGCDLRAAQSLSPLPSLISRCSPRECLCRSGPCPPNHRGAACRTGRAWIEDVFRRSELSRFGYQLAEYPSQNAISKDRCRSDKAIPDVQALAFSFRKVSQRVLERSGGLVVCD